MDRFTAKKFLPIIEAYCDGKDIEYFFPLEGWRTYVNPKFEGSPSDYRIKPTPAYRPFANVEECWEEMKKHEPFGWVKEKGKNKYVDVKRIDGEFMTVLLGGDDNWGMKGAFNNYIFADGSVFGKLTEE